jgi:hypothetical protein
MMNIYQTAMFQSQSHLKTNSQSDSLSWYQATIRARDQFFFLLEIFFTQLRVSYFLAPSLTRERVCNLLLLLGLTRAVPLGSGGTQDHILLSQFLRLPPTWSTRSPYLYLQEQRDPVILLGFLFHRLLQLAGL